MGSSVSSGTPTRGDFIVHTRDRASDQYLPSPVWTLKAPPTSLEVALGSFKREVYAFALQRDHETAKALYLYRGHWRLVRAELFRQNDAPHRLQLDFRNAAVRHAFHRTSECMATGSRWPLCGTAFQRAFTLPPDVANGLGAIALTQTYTCNPRVSFARDSA